MKLVVRSRKGTAFKKHGVVGGPVPRPPPAPTDPPPPPPPQAPIVDELLAELGDGAKLLEGTAVEQSFYKLQCIVVPADEQ